MYKKFTPPNQGFTLIEMLVVLGIIFVLTAVLLPVFSTIREQSRKTQCLSNLRQLGVATFQYAQDNDDYYPYGGDPSDLDTGNYWQDSPYWSALQQMRINNQTLPNVMAGYVKNRDLWHCPDDTGFMLGGSSENIPLNAGASCFRTYGMSYIYTTILALNGQTLSNVRAWSRKPPYSEHETANIPLFSDHVSVWHGNTNEGRRNMVMIDGHAINVSKGQSDEYYNILLMIPDPNQPQ